MYQKAKCLLICRQDASVDVFRNEILAACQPAKENLFNIEVILICEYVISEIIINSTKNF